MRTALLLLLGVALGAAAFVRVLLDGLGGERGSPLLVMLVMGSIFSFVLAITLEIAT